ncbi:MAG: PIN domain-containing protein [Bacteroidetes bacterium]|nr:PIN domain-containing protein [Bacteroidota bacterium]
MILLDTNIILRSKQTSSKHYKEVTEKLIELFTEGYEFVICPQVIYEFYVVATRPDDKNGLGLTPENAIKEINNITKTYTLLDDNNQIFANWKELVNTFKVSGKTAHDTRIVAFMQSHQIENFYTLNKSDFKRFETIITLI